MHRSPAAWLFRLLLCAWVCWSAGFAVAAEDVAAPNAAGPDISAIAPAYIPEQADQDERFAQQVTEHTLPFDSQGHLAAQLTELHDGITTLSGAFTRAQLSELTAPRLNSLEKYWDLFDRRLVRWQTRVQELTSRYSADAAELAKRQAAWEATLRSSDDSALAPALIARVNDIMGRLESTQTAISGPLNDAIGLGRRGLQVQSELDGGQKGVADAIASYNRRLGTIDMPPLWQMTPGAPDAVSPFAASGNVGTSIELSFLRHYVSDRSRSLLAFAIAWLASLPLFLWFASRERGRETTGGASASPVPVLRRPFSGWLLLGALALPLIFSDAPVALQQASLLVGLIPVIRLLPGEVFSLLRWLPYAIVALYFVHRSRVFVWNDPLYYRLHLLLVTVAAAAMGLWVLMSSSSRPTILSERRRLLLRTLGWLAIATLSASAIAGIVGNVSLAEMLTSGVIESAYIGLAIYAGVAAIFAIGKILLADPAANQNGFLARNLGPLRSGLQTLIRVGSVALWLVVAIDEFQIYRPTREWLTALLTKPLEVGQLTITLGGILLFALSVWLALWIARTARVLLQNEVLANMRLPPGVANSVSTLTYYALVVLGFLAALAAAGYEVSQLTLLLGALGVGIGLGLQGIVANFVSGLILMFERPIRPGDVVEIGGATGRVREIGMRATTLQTFEGADVVVPNGSLLSSNLTNWTLSNTSRRIDIDVGVAYSADPPAVQLLLGQLARTIPGISKHPEPVVIFLRFNSSSLDFGIRAWTNDFDNWRSIQSALGIAVHKALKDAGIEIPFPQQDLHLRSLDDGARTQLAKLSPSPGDGAQTATDAS